MIENAPSPPNPAAATNAHRAASTIIRAGMEILESLSESILQRLAVRPSTTPFLIRHQSTQPALRKFFRPLDRMVLAQASLR